MDHPQLGASTPKAAATPKGEYQYSFDQMDTNSDGVIDKAEFNNAVCPPLNVRQAINSSALGGAALPASRHGGGHPQEGGGLGTDQALGEARRVAVRESKRLALEDRQRGSVVLESVSRRGSVVELPDLPDELLEYPSLRCYPDACRAPSPGTGTSPDPDPASDRHAARLLTMKRYPILILTLILVLTLQPVLTMTLTLTLILTQPQQ